MLNQRGLYTNNQTTILKEFWEILQLIGWSNKILVKIDYSEREIASSKDKFIQFLWQTLCKLFIGIH